MRRKNEKVVELGKLELFRRCGRRDLELLASIAEEVTFESGEALCREGQFAYDCFVIVSGEVEVRVHDQVIAVLGPGEVVGEMALLDGGRRAASVVALTDIRTFEIERRRLEPLLGRAPAVARAMLEQLSSRLRQVDDELATTVEKAC